MRGPGWVPVSCINCTDCGHLCVCVCVYVYVCLRLLPLCLGPALAVSLGLHVPACLLQHFPLEMSGLSFPLSLGPCVIFLLSPTGSFLASHLSSSHVQGAPDLCPLHAVSRLCPGSSRVPSTLQPRGGGDKNLTWPLPPGVPVPAPPHPGGGGGSGKGPPLHRCCRPRTAGTALGVEVGGAGPRPGQDPRNRRQTRLGSAL